MTEWQDDDDGVYGPIDSGASDEDRSEYLSAMDSLLGGDTGGRDDEAAAPVSAPNPPAGQTIQDEALADLPGEHRERILALAAQHGWRPDDPIWSVIAIGGLYCRAAEAAASAAQAAIARSREEAAGAVAGALAEAQKTLSAAAAREAAALETTARTAVGQVVEDLRRRGAEAVEEAHRTIWQRIWPPILSLTTAIAVGVGVGAGVYLWAAPPSNALLIQTRDGQVWWAQQGQVPLSSRDDPSRKYIEIYPAQITAPKR